MMSSGFHSSSGVGRKHIQPHTGSVRSWHHHQPLSTVDTRIAIQLSKSFVNAPGRYHHSPASLFLLFPADGRCAEAGTVAVAAKAPLPPKANEANGFEPELPVASSSSDESCCSTTTPSPHSSFQVLDMPRTTAAHAHADKQASPLCWAVVCATGQRQGQRRIKQEASWLQKNSDVPTSAE